MTEEEIQQAITEYLQNVPKSCQATFLKAMSGRSLRAGINFQCYECMGWKGKLVKDCSNIICPLWPYRPRHGVSKANKPIMILLNVPVMPLRVKKQQSRIATFTNTSSARSIIPPPDEKTTQKASCITRKVSAKKSREKPQLTPQQKFEKGIKRLKAQLSPEVFSQCLDRLCSMR